MARTTIHVCDNCATEIAATEGGVVRVTPADRRRPSRQAELCDTCLDSIPGTPVKRRGRPAAKATS